MQNDLSIFELYSILLKKKKIINYSVAASIVVSASISLLMKNQFSSTTTFYPIDAAALDVKSVLLNQETSFFGNDNDVDRLISLGESGDLKNFIINKYNLLSVYEIDTLKMEYPLLVTKKFESNFNIKRTDLGYVEITVYDTDAKRASAMANDIRQKIDTLNLNLVNKNNKQLLSYYETELNENIRTVDSLKNSIDSLKSRFNINSNSSTTMVGTQKVRSNATRAYKPGMAQVDALEIELLDQVTLLTKAKSKTSQIKLFVENLKTSIATLETAEPAYKKSKPVRSIIVIVSGFLTLVLVSLIIVVNHVFKKHTIA